MDNELQKQIAEVLRKALDAAQKGGEWIAGQVPDVLREVIYWTIAKGIIFLVITIILAAVTAILFRKFVKSLDADAEMYLFACIPFAMVTFFVSMCAIAASMDALKAAIAPKLFLLEYAAHLLK